MTDPATVLATIMLTTAVVAPVVHIATKRQVRQDVWRELRKRERAMRG